MGLPIEDEAREVVINRADLNITHAKTEVLKALEEQVSANEYHLLFREDIELVSYNSVRNNFIAMFTIWRYPNLFFTVQGVNGSLYTNVSQNIVRFSNNDQLALPGI